MKTIRYTLILATLLTLSGCSSATNNNSSDVTPNMVEKDIMPARHLQKENLGPAAKFVDFSTYSTAYRFNGFIPRGYKVEYIPEIDSINIYDPRAAGETPREQSQIFIRNFKANSFLTLSTVDILERESMEVGGHDAVMYTIKKKSGVANFRHQPSWRSEKHSLVDVRLAKTNPSYFYVFAYNPEYGVDGFGEFLDELTFHNDPEDLSQPMIDALNRITKKPFGIHIVPDTSPVQPERFSGYHTGTDYEVFEDEKDARVQVPVYAICSGELQQKEWIKGYGGVVAQSCLIQNQPVSVVYGHIKLRSVSANVGDYIPSGTQIAALGDGFSEETDSERKHLHLGIHKGSNVVLSGYVQNKNQLDNWIDILEANK